MKAARLPLPDVPYAVYYLPETDSTNTRMKQWLRGEAPEGAEGENAVGACLAAGEQTSGRGRLGRRFLSPLGGLYFSLCLRADSPAEAMGITAPAAAAVCAALEDLGFEDVLIKWVNDVYYRGKKVCGILCEYAEGAVVCGIGINLTSPEGGWPPEAGPAGALDRPDLGRMTVLGAVLRRTDMFLRDRAAALEFYRARQFLKGREVTVSLGAEEIRGTAEDVDEEFRLVLSPGDGTVRLLNCGEVIRVRADRQRDGTENEDGGAV